jgi:hypothetical protein
MSLLGQTGGARTASAERGQPPSSSTGLRPPARAVTYRRSVPHLLLGAGLVVACALVFAVTSLRSDPAVPVLALARAIPAGQPLTASDLITMPAQTDPRAGLLEAAQRTAVVGRTLRVPLPAGQLLSEANLGASVWPPSGQSVVAVPVTGGRLPAGVVAGAGVRVVIQATPVAASASTQDTTDPASSGQVGTDAGPGAQAMRATVVQLDPPDTSGVSVVSLLMSAANGVRVASTPTDQVALVLQGAGS